MKSKGTITKAREAGPLRVPSRRELLHHAVHGNILMHARGLQQVLPAERALRRIEKGVGGVRDFGD